MGTGGTFDYYSSYTDRMATAFFTAALIVLVNLIFEFRSWRNLKVRIKWALH